MTAKTISGQDVAGKITPAPGGIGSMSITMLLENAVVAAGALNGTK